MGIAAFHWDLPKLSAADVARSTLALELFPHAETRDRVLDAVQTSLREHFGADASCTFTSLAHSTYGEQLERFGDAALMLECQLAPDGGHCLLHIDHALAGFCVDRILGGDGSRGSDPATLSETELGVFQYIIMHLLAAVHQATGRDAAYHFRYQRLVQNPATARGLCSPSAELVVVTWKVVVAEQVHFVRVLLPQQFLDGVTTRRQSVPRDVSPERARQFGGEYLDCWIDAGVCELTAGDVGGLETGDVVLLDRSDVQLLTGNDLQGRVTLRIGDGQRGGVQCRLEGQRCIVEGLE